MNEIIQNLIVFGVLIVVGIVVYVFFSLRRKSQNVERQKQISEMHWETTPIRTSDTSGTRYAGRQGEITWHMDATRTIKPAASYTGSDSTDICLTLWHSPDGAFDEGIMLLGYTLSSGAAGLNQGILNTPILQKVLKMMAGEDAVYIPRLREMALPLELKSRYMAYTDHPLQMQQLLTEEVISALIAWPKEYPAVIKVNQKGTEIKIFSHQIEHITSLRSLVHLGICIVNARQNNPSST